MDIMTGMLDKSRMVDGVPTSLKDLGYSVRRLAVCALRRRPCARAHAPCLPPHPPSPQDVGLDDNWQQCGKYGPNGYTFHSEEGRPIVNPARFPDFQNMTNYAHSLGLTAGWVRARARLGSLWSCGHGVDQTAFLTFLLSLSRALLIFFFFFFSVRQQLHLLGPLLRPRVLPGRRGRDA